MSDTKHNEKYPEHAKLRAVINNGEHGAVQRFYDFLIEEKGYIFAKWNHCDDLYQDHIRPATLLGEFFDIDEKKLEDEKQQMLDEIQSITYKTNI